MRPIFTFNDTATPEGSAEAAFYMGIAYAELAAGRIPMLVKHTFNSILSSKDARAEIEVLLRATAEDLLEVVKRIQHMQDHCDRRMFRFNLSPYLTGSNAIENGDQRWSPTPTKNGVTYSGCPHAVRTDMGGSSIQSPLFALVDAFLGVSKKRETSSR